MNVLLITQEPPLRDDEIVSGNAVRTKQIRSALDAAGHETHQVWLAGPDTDRAGVKASTFRNHDDLQGILLGKKPDAIIVSYWELLGLLPHDNTVPVVLDYVAPRPLEELFESPSTVNASLRRLRNNLGRVDLVLVGNRRQRHLMINTLIESGFDLRNNDPVRIVPLGAEIAAAPETGPEGGKWLFVSGGVSWPWRDSGSYQAELERFAREHAPEMQWVHFGGGYRWHKDHAGAGQPGDNGETTAVEVRALEPYRRFSEFLSRQAHVGVELAEWNIEREYSQSFRSLEFLRHGLPLLCNRYLPIAGLVERFDAGWIVDDPESLRACLEQIVSRPDEWKKKSANAQRLVTEALEPDRSVAPLLRWLESRPARAERLEPEILSRSLDPVIGIPPIRERLKRQLMLAKTVMIRKLLRAETGSGVVFVTRGDLFPPDHGAAVRTVESARAIARRNVRVGIVTDDRSRWFEVTPDGIHPRRYPFWTRLLSLPGPVAKLLHFSKDLPYSNSFLYLPLTDGSFFWRSLAVSRDLHAGVLQAEFPAYALPCIEAREVLGCSVVLVEHNVEYERIRAQVPELSPEQYENLKAIEINLCNRSDAVVCVSANDRQKLAEDGVHPDLLHTVPHGVNLEPFDSPEVMDARARYGIPEHCPLLVYHGTYTYPPNREALQIFADILLPGLEEKGLVCHLLAIGKDPPSASPHPRIHLTGSVEHLAPWLKAADLAVVPLVDGGGTRMKIIDCFAARLPVVSTSKGIEGIPVEPGIQAIVLDDWDRFMTAIVGLWNRPDEAKALARAGRAMADGLDWGAAAGKYLALYSALR